MEPKSGKLHKLGYSLFGPKWTEKWVHLDGKVLKYFPMATEQPVFSLSSSRQSCAIALADYEFALGDDKKLNRKFTFQFVTKEKARTNTMMGDYLMVAYLLRSEVSQADRLCVFVGAGARRVEIDVPEFGFRFVWEYVGWQESNASELLLVQQQVDPTHSGRITRDQFLAWLTNYYNAQEALVLKVQNEYQNQQQQQSSQRPLEDDAEVSHRNTNTSRSTTSRDQSVTKNEQSGASTKAHDQNPEVECAEPSESQVQSRENSAVDWNAEYEVVLSNTTSCGRSEGHESESAIRIAHGIAVATFLHRFLEAAELTVQTVIDELALGNKQERSTQELPYEEREDELFGGSVSGGNGLGFQSLLASGMKKFWANGLVVYVARFESTSQSTARKTASSTLSSAITSSTSISLHSVIAHKLLGHQVRAARAMQDAIHRNGSDCGSLRVPLQCTVDYLGFRGIVFTSISGSLLMKTVKAQYGQHYDEDASLQSQLTSAFNALGLMTNSLEASSSTEEENGALIPTFAPQSTRFETKTCEGNQTQHVIHDTYDIFPVDMPVSVSTASDAKSLVTECTLFKFRPEFVKMYGDVFPLHANAHLGLLPQTSDEDDIIDSNREEPRTRHKHKHLEMKLLQQAACSASEYLQCEVIPLFVRKLEEGSSFTHVIDSRSLTFAMHREGINMRYLGLCYSLATSKHVRRLLLSEMIARVCKIELRAALQAIVHESTAMAMKQVMASAQSNLDTEQQDDAVVADEGLTTADDSTEAPIDGLMDPETTRTWSRVIVHTEARQVVLEFFNLVFGTSSAESKLFWKERILPHMRLKFGLDSGNNNSSINSSSLPILSLEALLNDELLHLPQLFLAFQTHSHFPFENHMSFNFKAAEPFKVEDLQPQCLAPLTNLLARTIVQCEDALENVDVLLENGHLEEALMQIKFHVVIFNTAPDDERALPLVHLLTCAAELSYQLDLLDDAQRFAALAVENGPENHALVAKAHTISAKIKYLAGDIEGVRMHYAQALDAAQWHLGTSHPFLFDTYMSMAEIMSDVGDYNEALRAIGSCVEMVRECFGRTSLVFADLRRKQGTLLYASKLHLEEAVGVLEDAISVYEKHVHDSDSLTEDESVASVMLSCKAFAASCFYLIAAIHSELSDARSDIEKAYAMARKALTLRREIMSADHADILASHLQLGGLANELGDSFRALEYLKPALAMLKQLKNEEESIEQIRVVTQTMIQLQLSSLAEEKASVVERTKKRFATLLTGFANPHNNQPSDSVEANEGGGQGSPSTKSDPEGATKRLEAELLTYVMKRLFTDDPIEYFDWLVERTHHELQGYRKQYTMDLTSGTLRRESAEAPSPHFKRLQSPTTIAMGFGSRFASFGSYLSSPGSPSPASPLRPALPVSPLSPSRSAFDTNSWMPPGSPAPSSDDRRSSSQMEYSSLSTAAGEFAFGGQLAALLFLAEH